MTGTAVALLVLSAFAHAGWNLATKRQHPSAAFFVVANTVGGLALLPVVVVHWETAWALPLRVWGLLSATGVFLALYYAALAGAYRCGDLSLAYPLARSLPAPMVVLVSLLVGRTDRISSQCLLGILLVAVGCLLLPMHRFAEMRVRHYRSAACLLALLAAAGTAGYSLLDDLALRQLRADAALMRIGVAPLTLIYACLEAVTSSAWLLLLVLPRAAGRASLVRVVRWQWRGAGLTGVAIYLTYGVVLIAMAFVRDVSYVVAFRQLSILLGTLAGIAFLGEPAWRPKLVGVGSLFAGLVLVATG
ncbi:MAG: EamA family transporter [Candidatus Latescibacterota bacterium]